MQLQQPFAISPHTSASGFQYYSPLTINSGQVPSTQTDFPILISLTDNRLKTVGNGGHVLDAQGDDIRPYSDSGITTAITGYEKVFYDGTNGILEMWVKRSSVADSLVTYLAYGNASLTTDGSSTTTWSNNFLGVYHLADGTTLNVNSSTGSNNGTNDNCTATTGQIDGAANFVAASSQDISFGSGINPTAITMSVWVNAASFPNAYNTTINRETSGNQSTLYVKSNGKLAIYVSATTLKFYDGTGSTTLSSSTWYYLTLTYDSSSGLIGYVNASVDGTDTANGNLLTSPTPDSVLGADNVTSGRQWNGKMDEARYASVARSANWITTEYNNQLAPATFMTLGTEVPL